MSAFDNDKVEYLFDLLEQLSKLAVGCGEHDIAVSIDAVVRQHGDKRERAIALSALGREKESNSKLN